MSRRVPEAAVLVGVVLSASFGAYAVLFATDLLPAVLVAVALLYAFVAFAVVRATEPAAALPPDPVLAAAALVAAVVAGYGVVTGHPLFGLLVALVVVVPAALYHARVGDPVNPLSPVGTLAVAGACGAGVLGYGAVLADPPSPALAALDAVLIVLAAEDYRARRGDPLARAAERLGVGVCLGGAALSLGYFLLVARTPVTALLVAGALIVVGGYFALAPRDRPPA